jgi:1-acyl-sn-glycerol-3-phosphate acyltransferase
MKKIYHAISSLPLWISFWLSSTVTITLLIVISLLVPKKRHNRLVKIACMIMMYSVFLFPKIKGVKKSDVPYPVIYVANHVSFFDLFISGSTLPGHPRGVEIKSHFSMPIYGWFITLFGEIPIDPSSKTSIKKSFQEAENILKNGIRSILFMPEGHRTRSGKIEKFRYGAFYLSRISRTPVVPVVYRGLFERNNALSLKIRPGSFDVIIMDPVYPEQFGSDEEMSDHVHRLMTSKTEE